MVCGIEPWYHKEGDECFELIMDGKLDKLLKLWNKQQLVNDDLLELFNRIFRAENDRITIEEIKNLYGSKTMVFTAQITTQKIEKEIMGNISFALHTNNNISIQNHLYETENVVEF